MATRLYFGNDFPVITPAVNAAWSGGATVSRNKMRPEKADAAITIGSTISFVAATAGYKQIDKQFISLPISGSGTISGTFSGVLQVAEFATNDNVDQIIAHMRVVSKDGSTIRGTGIVVGSYGRTNEFSTSATYTSRLIGSGATATLTNVNYQDGDRIVLELGYCNSTAGTTPQAAAKWGDTIAAADLAVNETATAVGAPWIQFNNVNLRFYRPITLVTTS